MIISAGGWRPTSSKWYECYRELRGMPIGEQQKRLYQLFTASLKSANESKLWISLLKDSHKAKPEEGEPLIKELDEIAKIFASSILTLKGRR
jgi:four helix bundle protein